MKVIKKTLSLCPECTELKDFKNYLVDAVIFEEDGKVWIEKECPKHGKFRELYWGDAKMYRRCERYQSRGIQILNPAVEKAEEEVVCPSDCGLCARHKTHTTLANLVVTNRCDLACWYCFFFAKEGQPIYEPSLDQIRKMLIALREELPVPCTALQITGGEPTLRDDIVDIVKMAQEFGFEHIQFNTDAINFSKNVKLIKDLKEAGSRVVYMSFDGVTPETNPKNYWEAPQALKNCRQADVGVVLVPTLIKGVNDSQLGDIIRFGVSNIRTIRGINFQPVSLVGRMPSKEREKQRITIPDACRLIEEQTDGTITMDDFFPVPCVESVTDFVEQVVERQNYRLSAHFACGVATYVFKDGKKMVPITRFVDVAGLFDYLESLAARIKESSHKRSRKNISKVKLLWKINKLVDRKKSPKNAHIARTLVSALTGASYDGLREFHYKSMFLGMMHFMDPYNYDVDRVERCAIHYVVPDKRIIPFCAFNVLPELYRDTIQKKFSMSPVEWERLHPGKKLKDDKYVRSFTDEQKKEIKAYYKKHVGRSL